MEKLSIGQVVLATFPFSNLASNKLRPCLVIGIAEFDDIVLCQITSKRYHSKRAVPLKIDDFKEGSIVTDSFIRPDKIATLDKSMIKQVLGTIADDKLSEFKVAMQSFLEISYSPLKTKPAGFAILKGWQPNKNQYQSQA